MWKLDFEVPKKYGIRHTLGENGGPGALFFTLRTLPMIFDFVRDMEELCPNALFLNFSNPESRIVMALGGPGPLPLLELLVGHFAARSPLPVVWPQVRLSRGAQRRRSPSRRRRRKKHR